MTVNRPATVDAKRLAIRWTNAIMKFTVTPVLLDLSAGRKERCFRFVRY